MAPASSIVDTVCMREWHPLSWRGQTVAQDIEYPDAEILEHATGELAKMPALVAESEIEELRTAMTEVALGKSFVVQGGDCAEAFKDIQLEIVTKKRSLLAEQAKIVQDGFKVPVVQLGRIAGQYSKPRSVMKETLPDGTVVDAFRGDNINAEPGNSAVRAPDPERLVVGHYLAAATMSMLRVAKTAAPPADSHGAPEVEGKTNIFTSHEALHLPLEGALTKGHYDTSAHMVWVGERTRDLNGAHVEFVRGLRNPIGIKIGPTADAAKLIQLLSIVDTEKQPGRVTLITRMGANMVSYALPPLIKAVHKAGYRPVWVTDPCHGNTFATPNKIKTRLVETMIAEIKATHLAHRNCDSHLGGLHLEQTGEDVTECVDWHSEGGEYSFPNYRSICDPRLSRQQALRVVKEYVEFANGLDADLKA
ncbi:DAHP synthetase [Aulographum hederae CBS 113979]|uniref:Phospho-2-dehydro-3-deoxyheptonate aldolase n=1 Tax=Aulographum hederae CBS 113979 TaxID=1176131 RepID=A0A6G1H537_9PEZI|nr:DAHP synthetase [Aulographum hederae CBS 113979]